jgi:hypothetical protein
MTFWSQEKHILFLLPVNYDISPLSHCILNIAVSQISWRYSSVILLFDTILCDKICQWLAAGQCISLGTPVSSIKLAPMHYITEIVLKLVLNTITLTLKPLITVNKSRQTSNILAASSQCMHGIIGGTSK